jgi:hypothetical protein
LRRGEMVAEWFKRHDEFLTKPAELRFFTMLSEYDKK